jgi:hypothetical protein
MSSTERFRTSLVHKNSLTPVESLFDIKVSVGAKSFHEEMLALLITCKMKLSTTTKAFILKQVGAG